MPALHVTFATTAVLAAMLAVGPPATGRESAAAAASRTVRIENIDFSPGRTTVRRGGTVLWRFLDGRTPHNVTSRGRARFRSSGTRQEGTHRVRFGRRGTYRYVCTIHLNMTGIVVVR